MYKEFQMQNVRSNGLYRRQLENHAPEKKNVNVSMCLLSVLSWIIQEKLKLWE